MTIQLLELPDESAPRKAWLERYLVSTELRAVVMQWEAILNPMPPVQRTNEDGKQTSHQRLQSILTDTLPEIMQRGLAAVSDAQLQRLMQEPRLWLTLQEALLIEGGPYWQTVQPMVLDAERTQDIHVAVKRQLEKERSSDRSRPIDPVRLVTQRSESKRAMAGLMVGLASLAVCMMIAFFWTQGSNHDGRYFARAELRSSNLQGGEYLRLVATTLRQDWAKATDDSRFPHELRNLRDSCEVLLAADLHQVNATLADDIKARCRKWRVALTSSLNDLNQGNSTMEVREKTEPIVQKLIQAFDNLASSATTG